ncbi:unnamed protein product, partial [Mesorhabditis belari]|uniref:Major facilitator superfamily (MFS) profile domain-containing protein n=1 Tax=Mesorhabditis belari TaxID=2138241 RepID=A0AAF3FJ89_9BILA
MKLYAWEEAFEERIGELRAQEVTMIKRVNVISQINLAVIEASIFIIIFGTAMLTILLGTPGLSVLVIVCLIIVFNVFVTKLIKKYQQQQMKIKDERTKMCNEVFHGIKLIKLYAWEEAFEERIGELRAQEVTMIKRVNIISQINLAVIEASIFIMILVVFGLCIWTLEEGHDLLRPEIVFVAISILQQLKTPMRKIAKTVTFLVQFIMFIECGNVLFMVFAGANVRIDCGESITPNLMCIDFEQGNCSNASITWEFYSINAEWSLFCSKSVLVKDSISYQMIGLLIGAILWGRVSDIYGRRITMLICLNFCGVFGIASAFAPDLTTFTILRIFVSFFAVGAGIVVASFFGEFFPSKHRLWLAFVLSWSPNLVLVAGLAYLLSTWRNLAFVINILNFPAALLMWFMCETPHYLIQSGNLKEAIRSFERFHRINGSKIVENDLAKIIHKETGTESKPCSFLHLFSTPRLVLYTIAICYSSFDVGLMSYSLLFNFEKISGSLYEKTLMIGGLRLMFDLLSAAADYKFEWLGRKTVHKIVCLATMVVLFPLMFSDYFAIPEWIVEYLFLIVASMIVQLYAIVEIICNEIFPTPLRNTSYALSQFIEAFASILGPQIFVWSNNTTFFPIILISGFMKENSNKCKILVYEKTPEISRVTGEFLNFGNSNPSDFEAQGYRVPRSNL